MQIKTVSQAFCLNLISFNFTIPRKNETMKSLVLQKTQRESEHARGREGVWVSWDFAPAAESFRSREVLRL